MTQQSFGGASAVKKPKGVVERKRHQMFQTIRAAAIKEFGKNGVAGTSTQALADASGISKAQFHYYTTSKEDLYRQVLDDIISEWSSIFLDAAADNDPATSIARYIRRKLRHSIENPDMTKLFALEMVRGAPHMGEYWGLLRERSASATGVIQSWCDAGLMNPVDPVLFLVNIWAVTQHFAEYEVQVRQILNTPEDSPLDFERISEEATALFLARAGLAKPNKN